MHVYNIRVEERSDTERCRLLAEVEYDDRSRQCETYWFDFPSEVRDDISVSGNPWLVCLIPLAVTLGQPLRIHAPVDSTLLANIDELMHVWKSWYPPLAPVDISAESFDGGLIRQSGRTAAFFSGGVDAFFTVLRHDDPQHLRHPTPVDDLLTIWGFDIPLDRPDEFSFMLESLQVAAIKLDKAIIDIGTNIRTTRWGEAHWGNLAHGCGLGSIGLALEPRFKKVMIGSGSGYVFLQPWGSHYVTDPLLSTSRLSVSHDGSAYDRSAKTE